MNRTPVSVLIPIHNGERYVGNAIRSLLAQDYRDFEIIVLDDGSTDGSARVARSFGDSRVRVYRRDEHEGTAATRNHLLMVASFPLIAFLDADDVAFPERLTRQVAHLERHRDVSLLSCAHVEIDTHGQTIRHRALPADHDLLASRLLSGQQIPISTVLVRRAAIDQVGGFDETLPLSCEHDLLLKIAEKHRIAALSDPLVKCRIHARATSCVRSREVRDALDETRRRSVHRRYRKPLLFAETEETTTTAASAAAPGIVEILPVNPPVEPAEPAGQELTAAPETAPAGKDTAPLTAEARGEAGAAEAAPPNPATGAEPESAKDEDDSQMTLFQEQAAAAESAAADGTPAGSAKEASDPADAAVRAESAEVEPALPNQAALPSENVMAAAEPSAAPAAGGPDETVADAGDSTPAAVTGAAARIDRSQDPEACNRDARVAVLLLASGRQTLEAVRSVLDQSMEDFVLAVVTTTTDDALERGLELTGDRRILLLEAPGASRARCLNLGIMATRSRYISYLSDVSTYRAEHLAKLSHLAEAEGLGFVYSDLGLTTPGVPGAAVSGHDFDPAQILRENYIATESVLHRRDLLHEVGLFNEGLDEGMEWELWVYLTHAAPVRRLAEATVERMVGGPRALKLIERSPSRVRRHLAEKFSGRRAPRNELPIIEPTPDSADVVARAQERLRSGDWAGAAAELVEAASRPLSALKELFSPRYPEREMPGAVPRGQTAESKPHLVSRPRQSPAPIESRSEPSWPLTREPEQQQAAAAETSSAPPAEISAELHADHDSAGMMSGPSASSASATVRGQRARWLHTQGHLIGTGRSRGVAARASAHSVTRAGIGRTGLGNRRRAMASLTETPSCPLCGEQSPELVHRAGWYRVLDCGTCGIAFSYPRLERNLALRFFSDRRPEMVPPHVRDVADIYGTPYDRTRELGWVSRHVPSGQLVDVGCSWGYAMLQAQSLGYEVVGTELSRMLARAARERFDLEVHERDFTDLGLDDESVEAVLAIHSIQHLNDPNGFLAEARRVLKTGGVLVGTIPNFDSYLREILGRRWRWLDPESQPHHFRPGSLANQLAASGFEVELWTSEGLYGEEEILEYVTPEAARGIAAEGRGSEIGFIASKR